MKYLTKWISSYSRHTYLFCYCETFLTIRLSEDFGDLQVHIDDLIKPSSTLSGFNNCEGIWIIETVLKSHVLIEVSNIPEDKLFYKYAKIGEENLLDVPEALFGDVFCSLENVPTRITIMNEPFIPRGAAVFIGNRSAARTGIGHYVAVALRNDGHWEEYDDFKHKPVPIPKSTECGVQFFLYTREV
ncbi:hypothetical protein QTP88_027854 [Uroleucon formosanum]